MYSIAQVDCEENVVVHFFLTGNNVQMMEVCIFLRNLDELCLIGIVVVRHGEIIFEMYPKLTTIRYHYYQIGLECINRIQHYPEAITE